MDSETRMKHMTLFNENKREPWSFKRLSSFRKYSWCVLGTWGLTQI